MFRGCVMTGNFAAGGGALTSDFDSILHLISTTITGNRATTWGGGLTWDGEQV